MNEIGKIATSVKPRPATSRPPGPKGTSVMGVMRDFNRDQLNFIERCRDEYGDVVWMRFLYVPAIFLYHPDDVE